MKSFDLINRRTHLYLGLLLIPWLTMYGISSFMISHHAWFRTETEPPWRPLFEREYRRPVSDQADLRSVAVEILKDCGLSGAFWVERPKPGVIRIDRFRFWNQTRVTYWLNDGRLSAERQSLPWDQVILRMHFRGGFLQPTLRDDLWAILVDGACVGILLWIASGLIMWWRLARLRVWGAVAVGGGLLSFVYLVWRL
jgi:hypothetical protein